MSGLRKTAGVRALGVALVGAGLAAVMTAAVVGTAAVASAAPATPSAGRAAEARDVEIARIHAHFDSVLVELEARDVSALSATRRAAPNASIVPIGRQAGTGFAVSVRF